MVRRDVLLWRHVSGDRKSNRIHTRRSHHGESGWADFAFEFGLCEVLGLGVIGAWEGRRRGTRHFSYAILQATIYHNFLLEQPLVGWASKQCLSRLRSVPK